MIPFLKNVADNFYKQDGSEAISTYTFVFPNRRAGLFFQKYLAEIAQQPLFSPQILTIADLFNQLSSYRLGNRIEMLFILFDHYKRISQSAETFDEFLFWGEMLLNDFDDVDKYLVDAKQVFRNIHDLKEIDAGFSYLTDEQIAVIKRFWANFLPVGDDGKKKEFVEMWEVLFELYTSLRTDLQQRGLGYEGMIFREVGERAKKDESFDVSFSQIIFVGLNGYSTAENELLKYFQRAQIADFYWDYSSPLVEDPQNKASLFVEKNKKEYPSRLQLDKEYPAEEKPIVEVIGIPSAVGQAKYTNTIISQLIEKKVIKEDGFNTALILPDENLLLPTLYAIPSEIEKINVTMGYSLSNSAIAGLMDHIFDIQRNIRYSNGQVGFYFRFVISLLSHRYISSVAEREVEELRQNILQNNKIIVTYDYLKINPLLELIFTPLNDWHDIPNYLRAILAKIEFNLSSKRLENDNNTRSIDMECEFIIEYYKTINKMEEALKYVEVEMSLDTYYQLLKKLIASISVPFNGEPLAGLQIMGVLETRALDFDNLIILSMNEGIFPQKKVSNSFIPHSLRKGFALPTYEHQDGIFAYHFYRLINRAKRIYILYDSRTDGLQTGEPSRYFYQLKHLYAEKFSINEHLAVYEVSTNESPKIEIAKTPEVQAKLATLLQGGGRSLSASSINTYLECPLQFYFQVVERMGEEIDLEETIESRTFGTIYHSAMEWIYLPVEGKLITADLLTQWEKDEKLLTQIIEKSFAENYFKIKTPKPLSGQNFLTGEIIRRYIKQTLRVDKANTPFIYIQSEKRILIDYQLPSGKIVSLKGFIDRIDEKDGRVRIVDYKTGKKDVLTFASMTQLFDKNMKTRSKAVMQVFMYSHLYLMEFPNKIIEPVVYTLRELFNKNLDVSIKDKNSGKITDFSVIRDDFRTSFDTCLDEIFDASIPFTQTTIGHACEYCTFKTICKKD